MARYFSVSKLLLVGALVVLFASLCAATEPTSKPGAGGLAVGAAVLCLLEKVRLVLMSIISRPPVTQQATAVPMAGNVPVTSFVPDNLPIRNQLATSCLVRDQPVHQAVLEILAGKLHAN